MHGIVEEEEMEDEGSDGDGELDVELDDKWLLQQNLLFILNI